MEIHTAVPACPTLQCFAEALHGGETIGSGPLMTIDESTIFRVRKKNGYSGCSAIFSVSNFDAFCVARLRATLKDSLDWAWISFRFKSVKKNRKRFKSYFKPSAFSLNLFFCVGEFFNGFQTSSNL